tara:strand:- start:2809 stop:3306 length:498 start_codon:yes stop_codon:yes gene_type:complete
MELINNLKKLPTEVINYIIYMANPRLDEELKEELLLEASHMMLYKHNLKWNSGYNKFIKKTYNLKNYDNKNTTCGYLYVKSFELLYTNECISIIKKNLLNCGCCERHSNGIYDNSHCNKIRKFNIIKLKRYNNYSLSSIPYKNLKHKCPCPCRNVVRLFNKNNIC